MKPWSISTPVITKKEEIVRITAIIQEEYAQRELWYEVPAAIEGYLFENCLDAFLVAVLPIASMKGCDLELKARVSERLYHSLSNNVIPLLSNHSEMYHPISIFADELFAASSCVGHVGTGLSCGVDSFDAILSLMQDNTVEASLDTLAFFNVGSHRSTSGFSDEQSRKLFVKRLKTNAECAEELELPLLVVDSNIGRFISDHKVPYVKVHAFCSLSAVLASGSFFRHYYYSSAGNRAGFDPSRLNEDTGFIEFKLCPWLSTEYVGFSSYGYNKTRLQKVRDIADSPLAQKYLNVCWRELRNCGSVKNV